MATVLRPMSTGELLDRTFFLYRSHFLLFAGIVALPHVVFAGFQLAGIAMRSTGVLATVMNFLLTMAVYLLALAASHAATVVAVSDVHLGRPVTIGDAYRRVKHQIPRVLFIMIAVWLGIILVLLLPLVGVIVAVKNWRNLSPLQRLLLLVMPPVVFALAWSLAVPVAVLEDKGLWEAASRSWFLTKGHWGRVFIVLFLFVVLFYIVTLVWELPLLALVATVVRNNPAALPVWLSVVGVIGTFITQCLVGPLLTIALSLVYFDERVRKEAFDLQFMMSSLQPSPTSAAAGVS